MFSFAQQKHCNGSSASGFRRTLIKCRWIYILYPIVIAITIFHSFLSIYYFLSLAVFRFLIHCLALIRKTFYKCLTLRQSTSTSTFVEISDSFFFVLGYWIIKLSYCFMCIVLISFPFLCNLQWEFFFRFFFISSETMA